MLFLICWVYHSSPQTSFVKLDCDCGTPFLARIRLPNLALALARESDVHDYIDIGHTIITAVGLTFSRSPILDDSITNAFVLRIPKSRRVIKGTILSRSQFLASISCDYKAVDSRSGAIIYSWEQDELSVLRIDHPRGLGTIAFAL